MIRRLVLSDAPISTGDNPLDPESTKVLQAAVEEMNKIHPFVNGQTALLWHLAAIISEHRKKPTEKD